MVTKEQIHDALLSLGPSEGQVVQTLKDKGYTGHRHKPMRCPVAMYLKKELGGEWLVGGFAQYLELRGWRHKKLYPTEINDVLPAPVWKFVRDFDKGLWPELEV